MRKRNQMVYPSIYSFALFEKRIKAIQTKTMEMEAVRAGFAIREPNSTPI